MTSHLNPTRDVKADAGNPEKAKDRLINLDAKPGAITLDPVMTAVIVVDMQNDFGSTDIVPELKPQPGDDVIYKTRYSGFFETDLDARLKKFEVAHLIITGCTTSICVDSTVRDAMFRDYLCVLLADCMREPIGHGSRRSNHDASLLSAEMALGWVSDSERFLKAVQP